jgi:hypothetical protein
LILNVIGVLKTIAPVLRIRSRIGIRMFLGLPDPFVLGTDPDLDLDPFITVQGTKQKY